MAFVTKDSGQRERYDTGAQRDTEVGKPRYDLIPLAAKRRWAELMDRGAVKYGDRNWEQGIPRQRLLSSAMRHLEQLAAGDTEEDHAAAVLFNVGALIHFEESPPAVAGPTLYTEPEPGGWRISTDGAGPGFDWVWGVTPDQKAEFFWFNDLYGPEMLERAKALRVGEVLRIEQDKTTITRLAKGESR